MEINCELKPLTEEQKAALMELCKGDEQTIVLEDSERQLFPIAEIKKLPDTPQVVYDALLKQIMTEIDLSKIAEVWKRN